MSLEQERPERRHIVVDLWTGAIVADVWTSSIDVAIRHAEEELADARQLEADLGLTALGKTIPIPPGWLVYWATPATPIVLEYETRAQVRGGDVVDATCLFVCVRPHKAELDLSVSV